MKCAFCQFAGGWTMAAYDDAVQISDGVIDGAGGGQAVVEGSQVGGQSLRICIGPSHQSFHCHIQIVQQLI